MKAEIVNCFIKATKTIFNENGSIVLSTRSKKVSEALSIGEKIGIEIKLFGESTVKGRVAIVIDKEIANKIIAVLMGYGNVDSIEKFMVESVLSEYTNWIAASAIRGVEEYGMKITDYKIIVKIDLEKSDEKIKSDNGMQFLVIEYDSNIGQVDLGIAI